MVMALAIAVAALVGFGDSQLHTTRLPHYPAVSIIAGSDSDALTEGQRGAKGCGGTESCGSTACSGGAEGRSAKKRQEAGHAGPRATL